MELEFGLKSQEQVERQSLGHKQQAKQEKLVTFDENNNDYEDTANKSSGSPNNKEQLSEDEDWRSLSPNVEPTSGSLFRGRAAVELAAGNNNADGTGKQVTAADANEAKKHVSADLVCEKLREYRATCNNNNNNNQRSTTNNNHKVGNNKIMEQPKDESGTKAARSEQVPSQTADQENQLMSIDPSLCHAGDIKQEQEADLLQLGDNQQAANHQQQQQKQYRTEEQIANEDFSSSNSSFGPMSISMPPENGDSISEKQRQQEDDSDDLNSTQSGSVLTVIAGKQPANAETGNNSCSEDANSATTTQARDASTSSSSLATTGDDPFKSSSASTSAAFASNEDSSAEPTQQPEEAPISAPDENLVDTSDHAAKEQEEVDDEQPGSNIGVAFESLHFDSEIKSSKNEKVEYELLMGPPPPPASTVAPTARNRSLASRFNAQEVKSVCNFITAAISDATKQVESCLRNEVNPPPQIAPAADLTESRDEDQVIAGEESPKANRRQVFTMQRATFVQESQSPLAAKDRRSHNTVATTTNGSSDDITAPASDEQLAPGDNTNDDTDDDNCADLMANGDHLVARAQQSTANGQQQPIPKADLSSIFEANVRREIERFETNSMVRKSFNGSGGKLMNNNGLTEWRIAEEIRLFNERELELKKRFTGGSGTPTIEKNQAQKLETGKSRHHSHHNQSQQQEAIVRFGKTLQLPKAVMSSTNAMNDTNSAAGQQQTIGKSIKLSTSINSASNQQTTMISMHKFIASGGKRFVFTSSTTGVNGSAGCNGSNSSLHSATNNCNGTSANQLTKSMSNLSITTFSGYGGGGGKCNDSLQPQRQLEADYKAVDSLKCKETPNVEPGLTRKVIESFSSRFVNPSRVNNTDNCLSPQGPQIATRQQQVNGVNSGNRLQHQSNGTSDQQATQSTLTTSSCSSCSSSSSTAAPTAEWKIQEELREMRAREAELRSQRSSHRNSLLHIRDHRSPSNGLHVDNINVQLPIDNNNNNNDNLHSEEQVAVDSDTTSNNATDDQKSAQRLSFSSESLYPIKQAIDSFRKLNNSSQQAALSSNQNLVPSSQISVNKTTTIQRRLHIPTAIQGTQAEQPEDQKQTSDDYDSRVGKQRRKISMIEKWENRQRH